MISRINRSVGLNARRMMNSNAQRAFANKNAEEITLG